MKRYLNRFHCVLICLSYLLISSSSAQTSESLFMRVDYINTKDTSDKGDTYLKIESELWKPIHEERVRRGIVLYRGLYNVIAGEPDVRYDYIVVSVYDDFAKLDGYRLEEIVAVVYPSDKPEEIIRQTNLTREVVQTEIWQVNGAIVPEDTRMPGGKYVTVNFFDARSGSGEHTELEFEFWGRIHELRIEGDILNSWAMYTLLYPEGDVMDYTYSTIDYYNNLGDLVQPVGMELARVAHPDLTDEELGDYFNRTGAARSLYKTELWKLVSSVSIDDK